MDGDPSDICSIAAFVALNSTLLPTLLLKRGATGLMDDFDVVGESSQGIKLLNIRNLPILISICKVRG
jgi:exosome complex RNA-binding protein Rrp42 (RNase PH superfamily)